MSGTYDQPGVAYDQAGATYDDFGPALSTRVLWLVIYSDPVMQLYASHDALALLDQTQRRSRVVSAFGRIQGLEGENPNMAVGLVATPRVRDLLEEPPLGARAELRNVDGVLFEGVVSSVSLGGSPSVRIEA